MNQRDKRMKSCDQCKTRKVRCSGIGHQDATCCLNCARRNETCHFSALRKPHRRSQRADTLTPVHSPGVSEGTLQPPDAEEGFDKHDMTQYDGLQELYIDRLLAATNPTPERQTPCESLQTLGVFGNEYSLTFFSEGRLRSLERRLGHDRVTSIRAQIASIISQRMKTVERVPAPAAEIDQCRVFGVGDTFTATCIHSYFERVHPVHPFLDRDQFKSIALGPQVEQKLATNKAWSALFYSILALGSQYHDGGSFQPANNIAWKFFATSLALFPDLLITKATLVIVQAITAMAIFASNVSCMQFEYAMISEGVKKAQMLGYNRSPAPGNDTRNRTFWVLYCMEKTMTMTLARSSSIMDSDISSALPSPADEDIDSDNMDSFLAFIRLSRLFSRIYASLHSVSARGRPADSMKTAISHLKNELEHWRTTLPPHFQPTKFPRLYNFESATMLSTCIRLHYGYYSTMLHLKRAALQLPQPDVDVSNTITDIMHTTHAILEMTKYIDVQPYTPIWVLAAVPLTALFVLFDLVIENPTHPETSSNLALLDIGSGHFSRIEYASQGALPGSIVSEFAHIARSYVREISYPQSEINTPTAGVDSPISGSQIEVPASMQRLRSFSFELQSRPSVQPPGPPHSLAWTLEGDLAMAAGTDVLDMFGSYPPYWNDDWVFGGFSVDPTLSDTQ